jgi:outer membrane lipopolysaccharide assembly protein LptE/RlpB
MKCLLLLLLIPLALFGCGYTPVVLSPGIGVNSLFIEPMVNRTAEPFLDTLVTNSLVERLGRDSRLTLVKKKTDAEAILSGTVSSYSRTAVSYNSTDTILEYRSTMRVNASLRRVSDDKILWKDSISWTDESINSSDRSVQEDNETIIIQEISERLAEQVYYRLHENF